MKKHFHKCCNCGKYIINKSGLISICNKNCKKTVKHLIEHPNQHFCNPKCFLTFVEFWDGCED